MTRQDLQTIQKGLLEDAMFSLLLPWDQAGVASSDFEQWDAVLPHPSWR